MYQQCKCCVMDNNGDPTITFDGAGNCNYCTYAKKIQNSTYFPNDVGKAKLNEMIDRLKKDGAGNSYDCMMGISGGLDSSYLAYLGYTWGLRVLAVHIDDGFDTDISKQNIRKLIEKTGFDLITITPDSEQYNALIKAYMKAGVPNLAVPQDNILFAYLFEYMKKKKIRWFLSGSNFALECITQRGNTHSAYDFVNIKDIHKKYGDKPIDKLTFLREIDKNTKRPYLSLCPLNYIDYNRENAFKELAQFCNFEYYGRKHLENEFTAFLQLYWLPQKFNVDKRKAHLSSMIVSGQMTREAALQELSEPMYDSNMMQGYISHIKKALQLSDEEFDEIMRGPTHQHDEFKESCFLVAKMKIREMLGRP